MTYQNTPQDAAQNARLDALENTTLADRTLSNPNVTGRLQLEGRTSPATTPGSGDYHLYPKVDGNLYLLDSNGVEYRLGGAHGVGTINYITNPFGNPDTSGYYLYSNTAQPTPVTGSTRQTITSVDTVNDLFVLASHGYAVNDQLRFSTTGTLPGGLALATTYFVVAASSGTFQVSTVSGGAPVNLTSAGTGTLRAYRVSGTVTGLTLSRTGTNPIADRSMLTLTKDGSNRQGLGFATDFVIDPYLQSSRVEVSFAYRTGAGYVSGDVQPFIYDIVNDTLVPIAIGGLGVASTSTIARGTFQAAANSQVYRLVFHVAGTTTASWALDLSKIAVGPQVSVTASGVLNYCTNPDAEASASDWVTYADAAGPAPVDGTGGSPSVTFTRTTTTPLEGLGSFLLTKDAANRQGQGASTDFTIAPADQGKQIVVSFVAQSDANYVANDVLMYAVDVTNLRVIQLAPSGIQKAGVAGGAQFTGTFQASIDSTSYRLCFHVATTSALAYTLKIDRVLIAPSPVAFAAAVTDFEPYTPTVAGLGTGSGTFRYSLWRRVGDSAHIQFGFTKDGSNGSGSSTVTFTLPPGLSADTAKLTGGNRCAGGAWVASSTNQSAVILTSGGLIGIGNPSFMTGSSFPAGQQVNVDIMVPIAGWGSNVQVGTYDGRTVACRVTSSTTSMTASGVQIVMPTRDYDTHNAYNTANGEFVAPVAGVYQAKLGMRSASGSWTANNGFFLEWRRNGTTFKTNYNYAAVTASFQLGAQGACEVFLNAGDVLTVRGITSINISASGSATDNVLEISLVPGRSTLAAGDTVAFAATKTSGSQTSSGNFQDVASWTTEFDLTGSFNPTTGIWTCPIAGVYSGEVVVGFAANGTGSRLIDLQVNGTTVRRGTNAYGNASFDGRCSLPFTIRLNAGDQVKARAFQSSGGNLAYGTATGDNFFSIRRVG